MRPIKDMDDAIQTLTSIGVIDVTTGSTTILSRLDLVVGFLHKLPAPGLSQAEYAKFREHIEIKIKGLAGSAGQFALKFVDTGNEDDRDTAKRYQAEETALREVLRELDDRRNMTLAKLRDS